MTLLRPFGARVGPTLRLWSLCNARSLSRSSIMYQKISLYDDDPVTAKKTSSSGDIDPPPVQAKESGLVSTSLKDKIGSLNVSGGSVNQPDTSEPVSIVNKTESDQSIPNSAPKSAVVTPVDGESETNKIENQIESNKEEEGSSTSGEPRFMQDLVTLDLISPNVVKSLIKADFHTLTPVQQKVIPRLLKDPKGMLVRASTGTGKTLAFGIPAINHSYNSVRARGKVRTLIITPTRDLALQIKKDLELVASKVGSLSVRRHLVVGTMIGGTKRDRLDGVHVPSIIIATPGRLRANLENQRFREAFAELQYRVYDEADRLLEIGFEEEMLQIHDILTEVQEHSDHKFKSLLFSATVGRRVVNFAELVIDDYEYIDMVPKNAASLQTIDQTIFQTDSITECVKGALEYIYENIITQKNKKAVLFMPTIAAVNLMTEMLQKMVRDTVADKGNTLVSKRFKVNALHSGKSQAFRDKAVANFHKNADTLLVATDVAARGLHFKDVTHVVQCFPSSQAEDYVHKIGRTGRAGASGIAVSFLRRADKEYLKALQRQHKMDFKVEKYTPNEDLDELIKAAAQSLDPADIGSSCSSLDGYFLQIERKYRMNKRQTSRDMQDFFAFLAGKTPRASGLARGYDTLARGGSGRNQYRLDSYSNRKMDRDFDRDFDEADVDEFNDKPSRGRGTDRNRNDDFENSEYDDEPRYTPRRSFNDNNRKKYGSSRDRDTGRYSKGKSYSLQSKYGSSRPNNRYGGGRGNNDGADDW